MPEFEARTVCIDLDGTLCRSMVGDYAAAVPVPGAREALRQLRRDGWTVLIHTARHFNHWTTTRDWLEQHGFEYDQIVYGKPPARFYVDDRAIPFEGDWTQTCKRLALAAMGKQETSS